MAMAEAAAAMAAAAATSAAPWTTGEGMWLKTDRVLSGPAAGQMLLGTERLFWR